MIEVEIRAARPADADGIAEVSASAIATLRETYRPTQRGVADKHEDVKSLTRLVATVNGRVVGVVDYRMDAEGVHFSSLFVHSEYRRQGVARRLVARLNKIGKKAGLGILSTYAVKQTGNCEIFKKLGFRVTSEEPTALFESDRFDTVIEAHLEKPVDG